MRPALLAAGLLCATAAQAATVYEAPSGLPDTRRPIGQIASAGLVNGPEAGYRSDCAGSECSYRWQYQRITPISNTIQSFAFEIRYAPIAGATVRSLSLVIATGAAAPTQSLPTLNGSFTVTDDTTGALLGIAYAGAQTGLDVNLQGLTSAGVIITGQLTLMPGLGEDWTRDVDSYAYASLEFSQAGPVPEPAHGALWLAGLAGLGLLARRHSTHR
ncbi:MAG: hypothetical protein ACOZD0_04640 [Pseudomonadota bacterium]